MNIISDIVRLSPGYKSAVVVEDDIDNVEKVSSYIPTEVGARCIELVAKALNPECKERSFLITGTYGTGKSHLALVLCNLLKNNGIASHLTPVTEKINNRWQERYEIIRKFRNDVEGKPFVIVTLYQDEGKINDALLRKLDKTLSSLGLHDLLPDTVYTAALKRIEDIHLNHPDALRAFKKVIDEEGLISIEDFERRLKNYKKEAFEIFLNIHPRISHGAEFSYHQGMKAREVYGSVAKKLKEKGYAGILVLWDEFGRYLERSLEDPKGNESLELQEFAEACNDSYLQGIKLFTFLIAHREMQEYLGLVNVRMAHLRTEEERKAFTIDIQKIQKRFNNEIRMKTNDTEILDLIDHVIVQKRDNPLWHGIKNKGLFDIWTDRCVDFRVFPELDKTTILDTVIEGSYPLHPVTACCLPKLSEKVAQNERTLFQFLCKDEPNSVFEFIQNNIEDKEGRLNVITLGHLMDYFKEEAKRSDKIKKIIHEYINAERLLVSSPDLYKKIAKAIAVLNMASDERIKLDATPDFIAFSLNESLENVSEALETMSSKNDGERILTKNRLDGTYRFYGAGVIDIDEEVEKIISERISIINPIRLLDIRESPDEDKLWERLGLPIYVEPKSYNDDFRMNRKIDIRAIDLKGLEGFREVMSDGTQDGVLLIVLCETELEIRKALESVLNNDHLKEKRVLSAIPKQSVNYSYYVRKYEAQKWLRLNRREIFGEGGTYEDEWNHRKDECLELLKRALAPLLNSERNLMDFYWKGENIRGITSQNCHAICQASQLPFWFNHFSFPLLE